MTVAEKADAELMADVVAGDRQAFHVVYSRYGKAAFNVAVRLVGDARAEDVVQEVFVNIWRKAATYEAARGSLRSYILTLAHARAVDLLRSDSARAARQSAQGHLAHAPAGAVEEHIMSMRHRGEVMAALRQLPIGARQAIYLAYFEGCTYREAAARLHQPEGTVKSRISAGLRELRHQLGHLSDVPASMPVVACV